ncbi:hypothetical protein NL676_033885 [Syzygium grande]|nr:hypothetical protein NL676_033885 [Syzygium grande]
MDEFSTQVSHIGYQGLQDEGQSSTPIPEEVQIDDSPIYRIERQLGKGGNGIVCAGRPIGPSTSSGQTDPLAAEVAVKFQREDPSGRKAGILHEWKVYDDLGENHGIPLPRVHYRGQQDDYNILVMDLLGPSLEVRLVNNRPSMPLGVVACVAVEAISILEKLHSRGYIHGDVKPSNFLLGPPGTPDERKLFLIDLGLAVRWRCHSTGLHVRICYNVDDVNLSLLIEEAYADGLYVSSVASRLNLWAMVMDSGTGFTAQVHTISPEFLPQNWIRRQWARNYHITAVAGADNGRISVVMSKGPQNFRQSYCVTDAFPYGWIKRKWALGTYITAMATVGSNWVVVMSSAAGFVHQVVELDFQYPYEGIYERWNQGYFITSVAATPDQVAFVFSIPGEVPESWPRNYYMSLLCYGRPVS